MVIFNTVDSYLTIWSFVSMAFKRSWWLFFLEFLPFETVFLLPSLAEDDLELLILQLLPTHTWDFGCASPKYYVVLDIRPQGFKHVRQALYNWAPSNDLRGSPYVSLSFSPTFLISYHLNLECFSLWFLSIPYKFPKTTKVYLCLKLSAWMPDFQHILSFCTWVKWRIKRKCSERS